MPGGLAGPAETDRPQKKAAWFYPDCRRRKIYELLFDFETIYIDIRVCGTASLKVQADPALFVAVKQCT